MSSHSQSQGNGKGFAPMNIETSSPQNPSPSDIECAILPGSPSLSTLIKISLAALGLGLLIGTVASVLNPSSSDNVGVRGEGVGGYRPHQSKHSTNPSKYGGVHPDTPEDVMIGAPSLEEEDMKKNKKGSKDEKKGGDGTKSGGGADKAKKNANDDKGGGEGTKSGGGADKAEKDVNDDKTKGHTKTDDDEPWRSVPDPDPSLPFPRLAWLLSFPNSGTSYTMKLVQTATKHFVASNYGDHNVHKVTKVSVPFFDDPETFESMKKKGSIGPFLADPHSKHLTRTDTGYVMIKTHCGGYCFKCAPAKYTLTDEAFLKHCVSGGYVYKDEDGKTVTDKDTAYDPRLVERAVHLIRNPYDNIVSRYHLEHNHMERDGRTEDLDKYPRDRDGFRKFCFDVNTKFAEDESGSELVNQEVLKLVQDVPCHADFFRYVNWHNHAFAVTSGMLKLPTMVLHYGDYEADFDTALGRLMDFLGQNNLAAAGDDGDDETVKEFVEGKKYAEEYFTKEERKSIRDGLKILASEGLWEELRRYL